MARIPDEFLRCVFFLYSSRSEAKSGSSRGASGFFVGIDWSDNPDRRHVYAVTNKHCITNCRDSVVLRATKVDGTLDFIESDPADWHPLAANDISVLPISPEKAVLLQNVSDGLFVSPENFKDEPSNPTSLGPGDKVFMIGRFITHDPQTQLDSSARFGNISMNLVPLKHPSGYRQESIAVEMRSIPGYSGSPAFVYWEFGGSHLKDVRRTFDQSFLGLLGIEWGSVPVPLPLLDPKTGEPVPEKTYVKSHTSMSGIVPAWKLKELLNTKQMKEQRMRDEHDEKNKIKENPALDLDSAAGEDLQPTDENPNHRGDFMRLANAAARKRKQDE